MQVPASNLLPDRPHRFVGNSRTEIDEELPLPILRSPRPKRLSRPMEFHHRPLAEPSVRLSPHSAPIRQTTRPYRAATERRAPPPPRPPTGTPPDHTELPVKEEIRPRLSEPFKEPARQDGAAFKALELTHCPCHERVIDVSQ